MDEAPRQRYAASADYAQGVGDDGPGAPPDSAAPPHPPPPPPPRASAGPKRAWRSRVTYDVREWREEAAGAAGSDDAAEGDDGDADADADGVLHVNEFAVLERIGEGAFGTVHRCERAARGRVREFAIKVVDKLALSSRKEYLPAPGGGLRRVTMLDRVLAEVELQSRLFHRHIPLLFEALHTEETLYLVLELADLGESMRWDADARRFLPNEALLGGGGAPDDLGPRLGGGLPMRAAARLFRGAARALLHLHSQRIAHGDVKPANLLVVRGGKAMLADFGEARRIDAAVDRVRESRGTEAFWPPEAAAGDNSYDPFRADAWALGATLFCLVLARLPFQGDSPQALMDAIAACRLQIPDDVREAEPDLADLLAAMLAPAEGDRLPLADAECHPWACRWAPDDDPALLPSASPSA